MEVFFPSNNKHNASGQSLSLRLKQKEKSQGSNQVGHIHRHLLHGCIVKRLNVTKNPLVLLSHKVDSNSFSAKTATATNSVEENWTMLDSEATTEHILPKKLNSPMNVVLTVCGKVIVNDQGNLLYINSTSLVWEGRKGHVQFNSLTDKLMKTAYY